MVKNLPAMQETWVWSLGWEDPLENRTAIHTSILAWRIPWTEEPGGLQSMGLQRVWHDWENFPFTSVSGSKQNCAEGTEISHVQPTPMEACPPLLQYPANFETRQVNFSDRDERGIQVQSKPRALFILLTMLNVRTTSTNKSTKAREVMRNLEWTAVWNETSEYSSLYLNWRDFRF